MIAPIAIPEKRSQFRKRQWSSAAGQKKAVKLIRNRLHPECPAFIGFNSGSSKREIKGLRFSKKYRSENPSATTPEIISVEDSNPLTVLDAKIKTASVGNKVLPTPHAMISQAG